jgi:hypothetical protein
MASTANKPWLFQKGNTIGKGNSGRTQRSNYRKELVDADTPQKIRKLGNKLYDLAMEGDIAAARLWLDHVVGKPLTSIEVTGADGAPLMQTMVMPVLMRVMARNPAIRNDLANEFQAMGLPAPPDWENPSQITGGPDATDQDKVEG